MPTIFLSAGEASGEHYGALLIQAMRRLAPDQRFFGLGGPRMESLGFNCVVRAEDVAVMGVTEVIFHMPRIYREYRKLKESLRRERPDAAILIDFPDVNLRLAQELHRLRIPVIFFVSPQLWAWKKHRIRRVQRYVDRMLVIFPFEEAFYRERKVHAEFVGHPLADLPLPTITREEFATEYALDASLSWVALLPGSRAREIRLNLPEMVRSAGDLKEGAEFLVPLASTLNLAQIAQMKRQVEVLLQHHGGSRPRITFVKDARAALFHARASIVASGTATVEAALIGNPFIVVYRLSKLSYAVARRLVKVPFVAMVNLVAGREVVPELIQDNFTASNIVLRLRPLLRDQKAREAVQAELRQVAALLRSSSNKKTAIDRVAAITMELISKGGHRQAAHDERLQDTPDQEDTTDQASATS